MAHQGDNTSLHQQNNKLDGGASGTKSIKKPSNSIVNSSATHQRRASVGTSNGDSSRRDSSGKFSSSNNKEDVIPRYLRASTGSCHDFCKYGKRNIVEEKPWHSISKRLAKTPSSKLRSKEHTISVEKGKKVTEAKHGSPQETKTHAEDLHHSFDSKTISQNSSEIINDEVSLPPKEVELTLEKLETGKDVLETELKTSSIPMPEPKAVLVKPSPSSKTSEGNHTKGRINSKIKDGKLPQATNPSDSLDATQGELRRSRKLSDMKDGKTVVKSTAAQKRVPRAADNLPSSIVSTNKIKNLTSRKNSNSKLVPKDQNIIQKAANVKQPKNEKVSVKTLYALGTDTVKTLPKTIRKRGVAASSHKQGPIEETIVCCHHDFDDEKGDMDEKETGGIDDATTKLITVKKDASKGKRKEGMEGKITRTLRKGTPILLKDKTSSPMKLNFRRGKVIQVHTDNNTPIRLKFRRGRILLGNKDSVANVKKNVKKKGVADDKDVADPSSKKVVLRHQDVQDKKIDPGLLNNVIEETASKLVESRISKVKALVGAFETVISLQES